MKDCPISARWALCFVLGVWRAASVAAEPGRDGEAPRNWLDNYATAYRAAESSHRQLLVWFVQPEETGSASDTVWDDPALEERLGQLVAVRLALGVARTEEGGQNLVVSEHPAFADLLGQPGLALIELAHAESPYFRQVISILHWPSARPPARHDLQVLLDLPPGSLTQRTLIFAVRTHPEKPQSAEGELLPLLSDEATRHASHQASIQLQGHHQWEQRFHQLNAGLSPGLVAQEVCAESWPGQSLFDAARECVHSWRQSPGHWSAVSRNHPAYGYDMKRGRNGTWYATGLFGTRR